MLHTSDLTYTYRRGEPLRFPDLHCAAGEQWLLLGQSGTGKTTLLHLLGGLRSPQRGSVEVAGVALGSLSRARLDHFRGQKIGIIFQTPHFVRALSVGENLALTQRLAGLPIDRNRIRELLDHLNIAHKLHSKTDRLSAGEQQRVAIARALINKPAVLLADEPTSALDDHNCEWVIELIERQASEEGATLLVVTHDNRLKDQFEHHIYLEA
jgi:putative ABC transport system ATP-binding protein